MDEIPDEEPDYENVDPSTLTAKEQQLMHEGRKPPRAQELTYPVEPPPERAPREPEEVTEQPGESFSERCGKCGQWFTGPSLPAAQGAVEAHQRVEHPPTVQCSICGQQIAGATIAEAARLADAHVAQEHPVLEAPEANTPVLTEVGSQNTEVAQIVEQLNSPGIAVELRMQAASEQQAAVAEAEATQQVKALAEEALEHAKERASAEQEFDVAQALKDGLVVEAHEIPKGSITADQLAPEGIGHTLNITSADPVAGPEVEQHSDHPFNDGD